MKQLKTNNGKGRVLVMKKLIKKLAAAAAIFSLLGSTTAFGAPVWPDDSGVNLESEAGVVMDADSGAVLYGKNSREQYYPASITKIMTALLVLENCSMDEMVTFSYDAVYNVEAGSTNAGIDAGEQMTVRDCLYAMLLKSANEAANALAEHVSGSREAFAELMTQRAIELGCENTSFKNPSGLNDPDHYTSARDFALIVQEAWKNEGFREIEANLSYQLPPTANDPEGLTVRQEHKMMLEDWTQYYDPDVKGGKTGYTSLAGNTLATVAERDGRTLVVVILKGSKPDHYTTYTDTRQLLDYGFEDFINYVPAEQETDIAGLREALQTAGAAGITEQTELTVSGGSVTVPAGAAFSDAVRTISLDIPADAPEGTAAVLNYTYEERPVGTAYVLAQEPVMQPVEEESEPTPAAEPESETSAISLGVLLPILIILAVAALIGLFIWYRSFLAKKEAQQRRERMQARRRRLEESGVSMEEYDRLMKERQEKLRRKSR